MIIPLFERPVQKKENPNLRWAKAFTQRALKEKPPKVKKQKHVEAVETFVKGLDRIDRNLTSKEVTLVIGGDTTRAEHFSQRVEKDLGICIVKKYLQTLEALR